ncbi:MAG: flavin-containing monooxygenase [Hyphomicrobiales bacterium]
MSQKYCIIGAGASGLAAAKVFAERGIPFDCLEREKEVGGLWNSATPSGVVYETCHMLSSREFSGYTDFPMPEDLPVFPSHKEALAYLKSYAGNFGLERYIELGRKVLHIGKADDGWSVQVEGEQSPRRYKGVVIANGHHCEPRWPEIPGRFAGEYIHSRDYRSPRQLEGKRVLVIGGGNSGCDIAIDAAHHAVSSAVSLRRGYWFVPKFMFGQPIDDVYDFVEKFRMPRAVRQFMYGLSQWLFTGPAERFGLPKPEKGILSSHATITTEFPHMVAHGRIKAMPDIERFEDSKVIFKDGREMAVDMVVCATGFRLGIPFLDRAELFTEGNWPNLYAQAFHADRDDLFFAGMVQGNGSMWRLAELQSRLIASYIVARECGDESAVRFDKLKQNAAAEREAHRRSYMGTDRHRLETDFHVYRRRLEKLIKGFGKFATAQMPASGRTAVQDNEPAASRMPKAAE